MLMEGKFIVKAPIEKVWGHLLNPEILASCIPGCEKLEAIDEKTFDIIVGAKVGPISVKFQFITKLTEIDPPRHLKAIGQGEALNKVGTFTQETVLNLNEVLEGVEVSYRSNVNITGRLATFGDRIMRAKSKAVEREFTQALNKRLLGAK